MGVQVLPILNPASHPSGSSQCTSPEHPVSCIEPRLAIHFTYDTIHVSMPFSKIIPPSPSPTKSKRLFYTSVSLLLMRPKIKENFLKVSSGYYSNTQHQTRKCLRDLLRHPPRSPQTRLSKCPSGHTIYPTLHSHRRQPNTNKVSKTYTFAISGKGAAMLNPNRGKRSTEAP